MKRLMITVMLLVLLSILSAEIMPVKTENVFPLPSEISIPASRLENREPPEWEWAVPPQNLLTNYADYFQCYNNTPVALQPEAHGGGIYILYRVKDQAGNSEISYSYINANGEVQASQGLGFVGYYPDAAVDQENGDIFCSWHLAVNDGSGTYDCKVEYDLYHLMGCSGLWKDPPITVLNSDLQNNLDPTEDDEFIWPEIKIGPSPEAGQQRIYVVASNHVYSDGSAANPSENVLIMYADFDEFDMNNLSDLEWSYNSIPEFNDWNAEDPYWYRPFKSFTVIDNQLIFLGYRIAGDDAQDQEDRIFCIINDNYGEGTDWDYHDQNWVFEEENPSWIDPQSGELIHLYGDPGGFAYPVQQKIMHTNHFNIVPTHDNTRVTFPGAMGITFDSGMGPGYYYPLWFQIYPKTFSFDLITEEFSFCDVYPMGANPNDNIPMKPWDLDENGSWNYPLTWFVDWPIFHYDTDSAFQYNEYYLTTNEENGWMAYIWVDGTKAFAASEGLEGYESWIAKPELAVCISNDWGMTWSDPIFMNANVNADTYVPELAGMIPCFAYPGDRIEDDGDSWGIVHLFFLDDNDYGSYHSLTHGLNNGSTFEYAAMRIFFGETEAPLYGDIDNNEVIEAYDAALTLMYSIGMPTPYDPIDPIVADVDGNGSVEAYDAALILQYSVGMINVFPVNGRSSAIPEAKLACTYENGELVISATGELYALELDFPFVVEGSKMQINSSFINAISGSKIALASALPVSGEVLRLEMKADMAEDIHILTSVNSVKSELNINSPVISSRIRGIFPNPFNPETTISFELAEKGRISIEIYNIKGQKVEILTDEEQTVGEHQIVWNAGKMASGIYFLSFKTDTTRILQKLVLMK
ncbi:MAG: T9SS type A sorting domain-containing protein [Candidatus Cloacimonetes bacterium]|nr:T9SS type A sorting domain-containing protein [Candidatus Cloacimonadota bacterium]